jgi:hypothetical protein
MLLHVKMEALRPASRAARRTPEPAHDWYTVGDTACRKWLRSAPSLAAPGQPDLAPYLNDPGLVVITRRELTTVTDNNRPPGTVMKLTITLTPFQARLAEEVLQTRPSDVVVTIGGREYFCSLAANGLPQVHSVIGINVPGSWNGVAQRYLGAAIELALRNLPNGDADAQVRDVSPAYCTADHTMAVDGKLLMFVRSRVAPWGELLVRFRARGVLHEDRIRLDRLKGPGGATRAPVATVVAAQERPLPSTAVWGAAGPRPARAAAPSPAGAVPSSSPSSTAAPASPAAPSANPSGAPAPAPIPTAGGAAGSAPMDADADGSLAGPSSSPADAAASGAAAMEEDAATPADAADTPEEAAPQHQLGQGLGTVSVLDWALEAAQRQQQRGQRPTAPPDDARRARRDATGEDTGSALTQADLRALLSASPEDRAYALSGGEIREMPDGTLVVLEPGTRTSA